MYAELASLLSTNSTPVIRAPWVPVCYDDADTCCRASDKQQRDHGIIPHRVYRLDQTAERTLALRDHVVSAMSLRRDPARPRAAAAHPSVVYIENANSRNRRRSENEPQLIHAVRDAARELRLRFATLNPARTGYFRELQTVSSSRRIPRRISQLTTAAPHASRTRSPAWVSARSCGV